jgi:hypothetical protein
MKPAEDIAEVVASAGAPHRPWTAPSARRLATSAAESADTVTFDATEQLS